MKHYFAIFAFSITVLLFIYDYFTKKLTGGTDIRSKIFRTIIYLAAILAMYQGIINAADKID